METCEVCGNNYDKTFQVTLGGSTHIFDSFECAIHALASGKKASKGFTIAPPDSNRILDCIEGS